MKNYKFEISYDGTKYCGWEKKSNATAIQEKLENVLSEMVSAPVDVIGCGRTDAGVHAKAMIANAHFETTLSESEILSYMNRYLPSDICINQVTVASDYFHARYNAAGKTYTYTCFIGPKKPVFDRKYVTVLDFDPDLAQMRKASSYLIGEHDFMAFCSNKKVKKSTVRTIHDIEIVRKGNYIFFNVHGTGFLYNMVRIIVGTLLEVGKGNISPETVLEILNSKERINAGPTAPAQGLCLMKVDY